MLNPILNMIKRWLRRRKLNRIPGWAEAARAEAQARQKHQKVKSYQQDKQSALHAALKGE